MDCRVFSRQKALWIAVGLACFPGIDMLADVTALSGEKAGSESVMQKDRTVTVMVSDSSGELIGANVLVKGTTLGNVTDLNGCVVLQHVPSNAILEISFIGYKTKEVPVKDQSLIKVTLLEDSKTYVGRGRCGRIWNDGKEAGDQCGDFPFCR